MAFLFSAIFALLTTAIFLYAWRSMPSAWLFDLAEQSSDTKQAPHPHFDAFSKRTLKFILCTIFFTVFLMLVKKVALTDVFWGLSLFWLLTQIAVADLYYRLIPDQWSMGIAVLGLLRLWLTPDLIAPYPTLILCSLLFLSLHVIPRILTGSPALGLGDVKLFFALAMVLTTQEFLAIMIRAALLGGAVAAVMILSRKTEGGVPYGTVIAATFFLSLLTP